MKEGGGVLSRKAFSPPPSLQVMMALDVEPLLASAASSYLKRLVVKEVTPPPPQSLANF
jgi:hypothetical protein